MIVGQGRSCGEHLVDSLVDVLFLRTWWTHVPGDRSLHSLLYRNFNLAEAVAWWVFAALVLRRFFRNRRSRLEIWYALAFVLFGATDVREAWALQSWLLWVKLANLVALVKLRGAVIRRFYPDSKTY
jgi:hypothetical protein